MLDLRVARYRAIGRTALVLGCPDNEIALTVYTEVSRTPILDAVRFYALLDY